VFVNAGMDLWGTSRIEPHIADPHLEKKPSA
jgi:hypothetical protein